MTSKFKRNNESASPEDGIRFLVDGRWRIMRKTKAHVIPLSLVAILVAGSCFFPVPASAHCDSLDGPVVTAAKEAIRTGDPRPALIWVQEKDEREIQTAFLQTLAVRKLGPEAQALADTFFFETLVRLHRAGEGAPYTGLKPAGQNLGPAIPLADRALAAGNLEPVEKLLAESMQTGLRKRFEVAKGAKAYGKDDVQGGRRYVAAYVTFIHYVEGIYEAATGSVGEQRPDAEAPHPHDSH